MSRDALSELASGEVTLEEIEALYDAIMESDRSAAAQELLGMSSTEWTAFGHGVGFKELARWRAEGWPIRCPLCDKELPLPVNSVGWPRKRQMERIGLCTLDAFALESRNQVDAFASPSGR